MYCFCFSRQILQIMCYIICIQATCSHPPPTPVPVVIIWVCAYVWNNDPATFVNFSQSLAIVQLITICQYVRFYGRRLYLSYLSDCAVCTRTSVCLSSWAFSEIASISSSLGFFSYFVSMLVVGQGHYQVPPAIRRWDKGYSCYGSRQTLTPPSDSALSLVKIAYARFPSDKTDCPMMTS